MNVPSVSRCEFMQSTATTAVAGATTGLLTVPAPARPAEANQGLQIGIIGPGRRGFGKHLKSLVKLRNLGANIDIIAVSDVYTVHRDRAVDYIRAKTGTQPDTFGDYREMLQQDKIDAICIATPDHWHTLQIIDSLDAGKHVYCEKPMTHTIDEALKVVRA